MLSNLSLGRGEKGSKFWMQMIPNTELKHKFDELIGDEVIWLSPLKNENYKEYELREKAICNRLGIESKEKFNSWSFRQPQWDGIAVSDKTKTLYLVEAKAHINELNTICSASGKSKSVIEEKMKSVFDKHYSEGNFDWWKKGYYQLGNRLTFLNIMKEIHLTKYSNVKLVLLNFANDFTYRQNTVEEWKKHYEDVFSKMTGDKNTPKDVIVVYCDVKPEWNKEI